MERQTESGRPFEGLYLTQALFILSTLPTILAKYVMSFELFMIGRVLYGVACGIRSAVAACIVLAEARTTLPGISSGLISLYLNEIAPKESRGFLRSVLPMRMSGSGKLELLSSALTGLFVEAGFFFSSLLGIPSLLGTAERWPYIFILELFPTLLLLCCLPWFPESPKFLLGQGRTKEAKEVLRRFEADPLVIQVFNSLCTSFFGSLLRSVWKDCNDMGGWSE